MKNKRFRILSCIYLFIIWIIGFGQASAQDPKFEAVVSSSRVPQHTVFEIQFELHNANGDDFRPPDFQGFRVVGGPSIGSSTMIVNGQVSRTQSWSYSLLATHEGKYTIGAAYVVAGRKKIASQPVTITVIAAEDITSGKGLAPGPEGIKLVAFIEPGDYYPGQQIILNYKLLFRENVQTINTLSEDDYADFFIQNFSSISRAATYETIDGVTFTSRIIKSIALYAHQSGTYTIDPMVMEVGINAPYPGNQGFFTMRRLHNFQVASEPLTLHILPWSPDPSGTFSGAVGQYEITTYPGNTHISTDDAFSLRLEIKGNGDSRRWDPPLPQTTGEFEMYDPRIIEDRAIEATGSILHIRSIEYLMLPDQPGEFSVHVPLRYFNPSTKQYETVSSDTVHLTVTQGNNIRRSVDPNENSTSSQPKLKRIGSLKINDRFWFSIPHLFLFGLIVSGTFWGLWISYKNRYDALLPEADRKRSVSARHARNQLELISRTQHEMSDDAFFEKATEIYYKYLSEKFSIPPADLEKEKLAVYLDGSHLSPDVIDRALRFFEQCQVVRYGGIPGGFTRDEMIHASLDMIDGLEGA